MITCKLLLCAQGVIRNAEDNTISIFSILESIQAAGFPFFIQKMDVVALFERSHEDSAQYEILFRGSIGDTELLRAPMTIDFQDKVRNRAMLHVQGLVIPNPGTLRVNALFNDIILGTYEVLVEQIEPNVETRQNVL
jgi:hypothetical protein